MLLLYPHIIRSCIFLQCLHWGFSKRLCDVSVGETSNDVKLYEFWSYLIQHSQLCDTLFHHDILQNTYGRTGSQRRLTKTTLKLQQWIISNDVVCTLFRENHVFDRSALLRKFECAEQKYYWKLQSILKHTSHSIKKLYTTHLEAEQQPNHSAKIMICSKYWVPH